MDISCRNASLSHGALKIIDREACSVIATGEAGFAPHASKFLQFLLRDIAQQFPPQPNAQTAMGKVSSELIQAWNTLCRGGNFCRLLDTSWGVGSILAIFNASIPALFIALMSLPERPWCFGNSGRPTSEVLEPVDAPSEVFETPKVSELSVSVIPSNPSHFKKCSVSHPTYWHSNSKKKQRGNRRLKRQMIKGSAFGKAGSSHDHAE